MVTIKHEGNTNTYFGLSTDTKPSGTGLNGSFYYEMDTKKVFLYDEENSRWIAQ